MWPQCNSRERFACVHFRCSCPYLASAAGVFLPVQHTSVLTLCLCAWLSRKADTISALRSQQWTSSAGT